MTTAPETAVASARPVVVCWCAWYGITLEPGDDHDPRCPAGHDYAPLTGLNLRPVPCTQCKRPKTDHTDTSSDIDSDTGGATG